MRLGDGVGLVRLTNFEHTREWEVMTLVRVGRMSIGKEHVVKEAEEFTVLHFMTILSRTESGRESRRWRLCVFRGVSG